MQIVVLCVYMKWSYTEYVQQPEWFIELVAMKMRLDGDYQDKQQEALNRQRQSQRS